MSSKNTVKNYLANGYYHIYNRGVEKRSIFEDDQDYSVFLSYIKTYLLPKDLDKLQSQLANSNIPWSSKGEIIQLINLNNFSDEITLLAYSLMPNHFHLLVRQSSFNSIDQFMNSFSTRYVVYFNKKYQRVGPLYQDVYKAVSVNSDEQLLHLSSYMHRNSLELYSSNELKGNPFEWLLSQPSSFPEYVGRRKTSWIDTKTILSFFSKTNKFLSYQNFVLGYPQPSSLIASTAID